MPASDGAGWKRVLSEDFAVPVARGSFPGAYDETWMSYDGFPDTSQVGRYDDDVISVQDGNLDVHLHTENGQPLGAAPIPLVNGDWGGQTYGKFSVRLKADAAASGFGAAFLLWPDSENWSDGEIDFPEGGLDGTAHGYNHCPGNPSSNCMVVNTSAKWTDWHTYTIEWTPSSLKYLVDGAVVGSTTSNIPSKPMHWVMQAATTGMKPSASASTHLLIDWATISTYQG
jgi:beta-glucanase (GH16 family)